MASYYGRMGLAKITESGAINIVVAFSVWRKGFFLSLPYPLGELVWKEYSGEFNKEVVGPRNGS